MRNICCKEKIDPNWFEAMTKVSSHEWILSNSIIIGDCNYTRSYLIEIDKNGNLQWKVWQPGDR